MHDPQTSLCLLTEAGVVVIHFKSPSCAAPCWGQFCAAWGRGQAGAGSSRRAEL